MAGLTIRSYCAGGKGLVGVEKMIGGERMFDATVNKALDAIASVPTVGAQKAHLDFLREKFLAAEKEILKLKEENIEILRENRALSKRASEAEEKLRNLHYQSILADIGPCKIKMDLNNNVLEGYYCPKCEVLMPRGDYNYHEDVLICQLCRGVEVEGRMADSAKNTFIKTRLEK